MSKTYCFEVFPSRKHSENRMRRVLGRYNFTEKDNKYGTYFYKEVGKWEAFHLTNVLMCHGYKYKKYDKRWSRSGNYRSEFFKHHKGPYRCAYCGRKLKADTLEVDHFIPVSKAKSSKAARAVLWANSIYDVNNYRNLVAACHKCNQAKSDNLGRWVVIGSFGRFYHFWTVFYILLTIFVLGLIAVVVSLLGLSGEIVDIIRQAIGQFSYAI